MTFNSFATKSFIVLGMIVSGPEIVLSGNSDTDKGLAMNTSYDFSKKINVFPSLTSGVFNILLENSGEPVHISVAGQDKSIVLEKIIVDDNYTLDLSEKAAGIYRLTIKTAKENISRNLVVR